MIWGSASQVSVKTSNVDLKADLLPLFVLESATDTISMLT